jgi:hypothetical protein
MDSLMLVIQVCGYGLVDRCPVYCGNSEGQFWGNPSQFFQIEADGRAM